MTPGWLRSGGVFCQLCGAVLAGMEVYIFIEIMRGRITPYTAGFAVLWLLFTGWLSIATGVQMLFTGGVRSGWFAPLSDCLSSPLCVWLCSPAWKCWGLLLGAFDGFPPLRPAYIPRVV
jgi:hypothetical protein